ncbi:Plexin-B1 [Myotis brandtii]|uniref:Plexin-B1 n=1 Tax=Myotis brandtii TaxID=109478 RepID=S7PGF9_MYOBR|nr:Plexin-B1 [Myotis brandtii]
MRPANISREERREVFLTVPDLPPLWPGESYSCHFGEYQSPALPTASGVRCLSPDPSGAPVLPRGADHVSVSVELRLGAVVIAKAPLSFYDCVAITDLHPSAPVQGSTLLPVHVERKVRLLGRNLRLLQDGPGDSECVMELEGREVAVAAEVECELPPDTRCHVTCQQHQDPKVHSLFPSRGPRAGGTRLTLRGAKLLTGRPEDIRVMVGDQPCHL